MIALKPGIKRALEFLIFERYFRFSQQLGYEASWLSNLIPFRTYAIDLVKINHSGESRNLRLWRIRRYGTFLSKRVSPKYSKYAVLTMCGFYVENKAALGLAWTPLIE